jgi:hypothetical protein
MVISFVASPVEHPKIFLVVNCHSILAHHGRQELRNIEIPPPTMSHTKTPPPHDLYGGGDYPMQPTAHHYGPGTTPPASEYRVQAPPTGGASASETGQLLREDERQPSKREVSTVRKIRLIRLVFKAIAALFSLATSGLEINTYVDYWNTRHIEERWPKNPYTAPMMLVIGVGVVALLFDVCLLLAHLFRARWAVAIATGAIWTLGFAKVAGFLVTAVSVRAEYNYGITVGVQKDLWSWTCSREEHLQNQYYHLDLTSCQMQVSFFTPFRFYSFISNTFRAELGLVPQHWKYLRRGTLLHC